MIMTFQGFMGMFVHSFLFAVNMRMRMRMFVFVGVHHSAMAVYVRVGMLVLMGMLQRDAVFDHKHGGNYHDYKPKIEGNCRPFSQY